MLLSVRRADKDAGKKSAVIASESRLNGPAGYKITNCTIKLSVCRCVGFHYATGCQIVESRSLLIFLCCPIFSAQPHVADPRAF